ncbi:MAG: S-adenosylmethionine:tRNA ribosyltransferase-isomerase [Candidatus Shikimatogenerans sp. JK-2022]|nr:S-adenosylmethionine:tRNA ribosyltransferase-isomerase [Candidatus Shikimatogenerans bostrichidophilus]
MINYQDFKKLNIINKIKYPNLYIKHKLMIFNNKTKKIIHDYLDNLYKYFNEKDIIILNNSKPLPIKYKAYKYKNNIKSYINVILLKELNCYLNIWDILVNPSRKVRIGNKLYFFNKKNKNLLKSKIINNTTSKGRILKFFFYKKKNIIKNNFKLKNKLFKYGKYILHQNTYKKKKININNYFNTYSKKIGSILLPTSGTYLNKNIFLKLKIKNVNILKITYHLNFNRYFKFNFNTFYNNIYLNNEHLIIKKKTVKKINNLRKKNIKICSIGSNTLRSIESLILLKYNIIPYNNYIKKMLPFPYKYKFFNSLLTYFNDFNTFNFIILLNMCGFKYTYIIYLEAIKNNYKFNLYGDLLLII